MLTLTERLGTVEALERAMVRVDPGVSDQRHLSFEHLGTRIALERPLLRMYHLLNIKSIIKRLNQFMKYNNQTKYLIMIIQPGFSFKNTVARLARDSSAGSKITIRKFNYLYRNKSSD